MKHFITLIMALAVLCVSAQDPNATVDRFLVPQGQWGIHIEGNPYTWAWSYISHSDIMDASGFGVLNLGLGAEYAYHDNRSLRLMGHAGFIGHNDFVIGESFEDFYPPSRVVDQITIDLQHFWYCKRLAIGIGPSFERRMTIYRCKDYQDYILQNAGHSNLVNRATETYEKFGPRDFEQQHLSLGLRTTMAFRVFPNWYVGLEYAPRVTCSSKLNYKTHLDDESHTVVTEPTIKTSTGHVDHQLSFVIGCRINLTKRNH